ncbi:Ig-like domain-containing protein [Hymenobacter sp. 15J16-1T3B]|uniref:LamG-like jellyroll fold domain-containing protein n=1 Tax=Hymenobacter sp. 15J16-1T3B TaxID=2886941 RepID=UPI001D102B1E|nr:Ig-like domain-containing protein [Hymenobacter sp. 15J16-1T3B]MCC3156310.1 Ig-like domain-containing protein [Hymenobacter sp. 15J16-1T3B]
MTSRLLLLWLFLLSAVGARAQTTLKTLDFDANNDYTATTIPASGVTRMFDRTNANPAATFNGGVAINGISGFYWASEQVKRAGQGDPALAVTVNSFPVGTSYSNIQITVSFADARATSTTVYSWEEDDFIKVEYRFNGTGGWTTAGQFTSDRAAGFNGLNYPGQLRRDLDLDGQADDDISASNPALDNTMRPFTFDVAGSGTTMEVRVLYDQTNATEELAMDNIIVRGTAGGNQSPVLANIEGTSLTYAEGAPAVNITGTLTVADADHANISSAQVRIAAAGFNSSEDRLLFTDQNGIAGTYNPLTGILSLTGSASKANYQTALRSVQYQNIDAANASTATRTVSFTVTDPAGASSAPVTRDISITAALDPIAALPFIETFETDGEGTRYASNTFVVNGGTQFLRTTDNPRSTAGNTPTTFSGITGSAYWFGENAGLVDNPSAVDNGTLTTRQINAAGFTGVNFSIRLAASTAGTTWQTTDYFKIYYRTGGAGAWTPFASWRGTGTGIGGAGVMRQDSNPAAAPGSTAPTGTQLTTALNTFSFPLPALNGQVIEFQLVLVNTSSTNDFAFDQIEVTASPAVSTAAPTTITGTSAVLGGNVTSDGGASISGRGVVYSSSNTTPTIGGAGVTTDPNGTGTGTFSEPVSGLAPGTTYYVAAYATNAAGTSYGTVRSFTTQTSVVSIVRASANPTNAGTVNYTVTFANAVSGLTTSNFSVSTTGLSGASLASVAGSGATYTVTVNTGSGSGTLQLNLANSNGLSPGVSNAPFGGETYTIDKTGPTVIITSTAGASGSSTTTSPVPFTVTFSESVTGFVASDVTVGNGSITAGSFSGSGATYTFTVTPTTPGTATTVNVPAAVAQDAVGNTNTAATQFTITYSLPSTTVTSVTRLTPSPTATTSVSYRVVFANSVTGVTTSNFSVTSTTAASVASVAGSGTTWTVTVNTGSGNGTLTLNVQNSTGISPTVTNVPYTSGEQYTITKSFAAAPQLSLRGAGSASGSVSDVTAFVDLVQVVQNGTSTAVANALQNGSFESNNVPAGSFLYAGSVVAAPWTFGAQAGVSRTNSGFGSTAPSGGGDAVGLLQAFNGSNSSIAQNLAVPTGTYQVTFAAVQRGNNGASDQVVNVFLVEGGTSVFLGSIQPTSTSAYQSFTSAAFSVTAPALTATISSTASNPTSTSPIPVTVTFSASVTGFVAGDVTVTNGTLSGFAGSGTTYTFSVTPTASGTVTVNVPAGVAVDANNTGNTAATQFSITYTQPVTAAPVVTAPANGSTINTSTPAYSGTAPANSTVTVYADLTSIGTTTATGAGTWSLAQPSALSQGSHTVYATAQLSGQTVSPNSNVNTFVVDTTPPAAPVVTAPANGSTVATTVPTYNGTAEPNATVTVIVDGAAVGTTAATGAGTWSLAQPTALSQGSHTVRAVAADAAGNTSVNSNTNTFIVDTVAPAAPVVTAPANGSTIGTNIPTYIGTTEPNATVTVIVDGAAIGTATANGSGTWSRAQPSALTTGSHTVRAVAADAAGNTSPSSATNTFTVANPATYTSSTADQPNTNRLLPGSTDQAILRVAVTIGGGPDLPLSAQSFSFTTNGSTAPADIAAARLYYTGTSGTFALTTPFGSAVTSPNGAFTVTGTQQLVAGVNYFWLVYDVSSNAQAGHLLDATVPSLTVGGTVYNPTVTAPAGSRRIVGTSRVPGQALRLTGGSTAGYLDFSADATNPAAVLNGSYTQEVWIKPDIGTGSSTYYVLGNGTGTTAAPYIAVTGNGRVEAGYGKGSTAGGSPFRFAQTGPNTIPADEWSQVVATFNGSTLTLYLNGNQVASTAATEVPPATPVNYVGGVATSGTSFFPGDIDEVSQWNRALSVTEIRQLRRLIRSGVETGLVSYLQFNDSGATITDISGSVGVLGGSAVQAPSTVPVGYGTSNLQTVAANGAVTFTGTNTRINFAGVSGSSDVVVSRLDGRPSGAAPVLTGAQKTYVPAYWIIDEYGSLTFNNTTTVTYTLSPTDISLIDQATPSNLKLFLRGGNSDQGFGTTLSASSAVAAAGTVTYALTGGVANFGQTVIGTFGTSPLPVTLVRFTAERTGEDGLLRWTTAQEKDNAYFEVESSADGRTFRPVGRVEGHGTSTAPHDYRLTDRALARYGAPVVYYRLRQVDTDGSAHLSDVVALQLAETAATAEIFPNPTADQLTVRLRGLDAGQAQAQLFDAQGRLVYQFPSAARSGSDLRTAVGHLPSGVYTLRLTLPGRVLHRSVVISH